MTKDDLVSLDTALKMAIEALDTLMMEKGSIYQQALEACKEALEQPAQEPVACMFVNNDGECEEIGHLRQHYAGVIPDDFEPLYTHPCVLTHTALSCKDYITITKASYFAMENQIERLIDELHEYKTSYFALQNQIDRLVE